MSSFRNYQLRFLTAAIGLGVAIGCSGYRSGEAAGELAAPRIFFTNESLDQAAVYAVSGSRQVRIGTVMAGRTDTLVVPSTLLSGTTLRLVARPLAHSIAPQSGPLTINPGDELAVRLTADQTTLIVLPARP